MCEKNGCCSIGVLLMRKHMIYNELHYILYGLRFPFPKTEPKGVKGLSGPPVSLRGSIEVSRRNAAYLRFLSELRVMGGEG